MGPLVSLAMIVRDEAETLPAALQSVQGVVDEIVVVDTGSTDDTVQIAEGFGAQVVRQPWSDDFSAARNRALKHCTGRWILVLDADECLEVPNPSQLRGYLQQPQRKTTDTYLLRILNQQRDGQAISSFHAPRLFARHPTLKYTGRIHERPSIEGGRTIRLDGLQIVHTGYDPQVYRDRRKSERALKLLTLDLAEHPGDPVLGFYLGREYVKLQRFTEAITVLSPSVEQLLDRRKGPVVEAVYTLLKAFGADRGRLPQAIALLQRTLEISPEHPDLLFSLGKALYLRGEPADLPTALSVVQKAMSCRHASQISEVMLAHHQGEATQLIEQIQAASATHSART
ncbi:MAG: glycosyltransferase [Bradymonadia bacterium]